MSFTVSRIVYGSASVSGKRAVSRSALACRFPRSSAEGRSGIVSGTVDTGKLNDTRGERFAGSFLSRSIHGYLVCRRKIRSRERLERLPDFSKEICGPDKDPAKIQQVGPRGDSPVCSVPQPLPNFLPESHAKTEGGPQRNDRCRFYLRGAIEP